MLLHHAITLLARSFGDLHGVTQACYMDAVADYTATAVFVRYLDAGSELHSPLDSDDRQMHKDMST